LTATYWLKSTTTPPPIIYFAGSFLLRQVGPGLTWEGEDIQATTWFWTTFHLTPELNQAAAASDWTTPGHAPLGSWQTVIATMPPGIFYLSTIINALPTPWNGQLLITS